MEERNRKEQIFQIFTYFCLALALVSTVSYMIYVILNSSNLQKQIVSIISVIILAIFSVLYVVMGMFAKSKKVKIFLIIGSLLLSFYSMFQLLTGIFSTNDYVLDFTGKDIKEVVSWADERNILVEQTFQNSDEIEKYKVMEQDTKAGTSTKKIQKIKVIVSDGPDENKKTEITNMIGWKLDDVIQFIEENHLTNVTILFEFNEEIEKDIIFEQDVIDKIQRKEPITLKSSLGKEEDLPSVTMANLVGLDTFHALIYLGRNHLNYQIEYAYSEDQEEGTVLKQSISKFKIIHPNDKTQITITIAKENEITVTDLSKMNQAEVTTWATNNRLKVEFQEDWDDTIKKGKVISYSPTKGTNLEVGDTITVTISKGPLRMIAFKDIDSFKKWADENNVIYSIDYQFSDTIESGQLISSSHKKDEIIKNNDTVKLIISQGGNTTVPNLIGMTKEEAEKNCKKANINCKFVYEGKNQENTTVIKQSMRSGSTVPDNTTVTVTLGK